MLGARYDVMVDWAGRLRRESPFFEQVFAAGQARRVLDLGCGTGWHAAHFASLGFQVVGVDPSPALLAVARSQHAGATGVSFVEGGFGALRERTGGGFDAVYCIGNTLPHVRDQADLESAIADIAGVLRPGGSLVVQQLNYDAILAQGRRFLPIGTRELGGEEYIFFRFYDFAADNLMFNVAVFQRGPAGWDYTVDSTQLLALGAAELTAVLARSGFIDIRTLGSYAGEPFDPERSGDLVVTARRAGA
jgi:SAM-dependent methyltransferase